jgi:outer membrane protein OmpA-like peptidoglycan-associated protein/phage baseplate assembly protein W
MAIELGNVKVADLAENDYKVLGIGINKSSNSNGVFSTNYTTLTQAKDNLKNLILTKKGERLMNPDFGTIIWDMLFEPLDDDSQQIISYDVKRIVRYDPRLAVQSVSITEQTNGLQIQISLTYVPTDPKFETVETTVEIEVLAKAKITWGNPASIVEGTALSTTQLNATASVPGTFAYSPATGAVLPVGKQVLKVTFTPTDARLTPVTAEVTIDVTAKPEVIPAPPVSPTYSVTGAPKTSIYWGAGANAATYTVLVDGKSACSVAELTCEVARLLGPKNVVTVTSVATGGKTSAAVRATYAAPAAAQVLSVVNFDSARAVIKSTEAAKLRAFAATVRVAGYTTLTVYGHTDSVGGVDNRKLSISRANSTITFLKKILPGVKFTVSGFAASTPVADNSTTEGKAANRRAEIFIP